MASRRSEWARRLIHHHITNTYHHLALSQRGDLHVDVVHCSNKRARKTAAAKEVRPPRVCAHATEFTLSDAQMAARVQRAYGFGRVMETLRAAQPVLVGHNFLWDSGHLVKLGDGRGAPLRCTGVSGGLLTRQLLCWQAPSWQSRGRSSGRDWLCFLGACLTQSEFVHTVLWRRERCSPCACYEQACEGNVECVFTFVCGVQFMRAILTQCCLQTLPLARAAPRASETCSQPLAKTR